MSKLIQQAIDSLLKETSRSFYLTLKALPPRIRPQIGLGYLLARIADTIADAKGGPTDQRLRLLEQFNDRIQGRTGTVPNLVTLARLQCEPAEAQLLENVAAPVSYLEQFAEHDQQRIRQVLDTITSGQMLDLKRFAYATGDTIIPLAREEELDEYTYRVAGCVGEFWTHLSLAHLFEANAATEARLLESGVRFGKGLQLVNILRDLPADLRMGRCYLPAAVLAEHDLTPSDLLATETIDRFRPVYDSYLDKAAAHLDDAVEYIGLLPYRQFRLRPACLRPGRIGPRPVAWL
ncbi:MAG: phytoene/squalene synthase family protein, partial [Verrucomicrobiota bacterium]|nr:phytoene/squalene synthase family protein [Verrucomicrobiota bacterium]